MTAPLKGSQECFLLTLGRVGIDPYDFDNIGVPHTVAGYVWKGVINSATVHGFMILCPRWYLEDIVIIIFLEDNVITYCLFNKNKNVYLPPINEAH